MFIIKKICVSIRSCDTLSHKSPCAARQAIEARYNQEAEVSSSSTICNTLYMHGCSLICLNNK